MCPVMQQELEQSMRGSIVAGSNDLTVNIVQQDLEQPSRCSRFVADSILWAQSSRPMIESSTFVNFDSCVTIAMQTLHHRFTEHVVRHGVSITLIASHGPDVIAIIFWWSRRRCCSAAISTIAKYCLGSWRATWYTFFRHVSGVPSRSPIFVLANTCRIREDDVTKRCSEKKLGHFTFC